MLTTHEREVIQKARDLIADPKRWCQGHLAMGGAGAAVWQVPVPPRWPGAARWCAHGALTAYNASTEWEPLFAAARRLFPESEHPEGLTSLAWVNDNLGHEAVLAVFDKVLADETA